MKYGDLVRAPAGTVCYYETPLADRVRTAGVIQSYATRTGAVIRNELLNAFNSKHQPRYLLRVEVMKSGAVRKVRGRKGSASK